MATEMHFKQYTIRLYECSCCLSRVMESSCIVLGGGMRRVSWSCVICLVLTDVANYVHRLLLLFVVY